MTWFPVSGRAFDAVVSERDQLRERNDGLTDQIVSMVRASNGLRETPRKKREPAEPVPLAIREIVNKWENESSRRDMLRQVLLLRRHGKSWEEIERVLIESIRTQQAPALG